MGDDDESVRLRKQAMARNREKDPEWHAAAEVLLPTAVSRVYGSDFLFEDVRVQLLALGLREPYGAHPEKHWGPLATSAVAARLIEDTGRTARTKDRRSKACRKPVYRKGSSPLL